MGGSEVSQAHDAPECAPTSNASMSAATPMPPATRRLSRRVLIIGHDLVVTTAAFPLAMLLRDNFMLVPHHIEPMINGTVLVFLIAAVVFNWFRLHRVMWSYASLHDLERAARAVTAILALFIPAMFFLDRLEGVPRAVPAIFWCIAMVGLSLSRVLYRSCADHQRTRRRRPSADEQRVLVVGNPKAALVVIETLASERHAGCRIVGIISDPIYVGRTLRGIPILGHLEESPRILGSLEIRGLRPDRIIIAEPHANLRDTEFQCLLRLADARQIQIDRSPMLRAFGDDSDEQETRPSLSAEIVGARGYHRAKRMFDGMVAGLALLLAAPLIGVIAITTLTSVGCPIFFDQMRAGRKMRGFALHKFRTMGDPLGPDGTMRSDEERMTRIGALLRRTRLDELPQLWNVFVGHMSLVGPRPLLPRDLPLDDHTALRERYSVRPGLTGWAQVNGGQQLTAAEKMALDLYYIRHASFWFDMKILVLTMRMVVLGERINQHEIERAKTALVMA